MSGPRLQPCGHRTHRARARRASFDDRTIPGAVSGEAVDPRCVGNTAVQSCGSPRSDANTRRQLIGCREARTFGSTAQGYTSAMTKPTLADKLVVAIS